jgi:aminopeptidase-like protein
LNYSVPFRGTLSRQELEPHLHTRPDLPDAIPYMTTYYNERWGFCISENQKRELADGDYNVVVDTALFDGGLTVSDCILPGTEPGEVLISTYTCHPSMANNELSGPLLAIALYRRLAALPERRWTYRFVFNPETIGSIAYLHHNGDALRRNLIAGIVLTCVGDDGPYSVKFSRRGGTMIDRIARLTVSRRANHQLFDFYPALGSDERQYCSPGFNFPLVVLMRSLPAKFKEYHTSLDNRDIVNANNISDSCDCLFEIIEALELNRPYLNLIPDGEPQLGARGLYGDAPGGTRMSATDFVGAILWVMSYSDNEHDLLDISEMSGIPIQQLALAAEKCVAAGILAVCDDTTARGGR